MNHTLARALLPALVLLNLVCRSVDAQEPTPTAPQPQQPTAVVAEATDAQKRLASFELVWKTVNEKFYDPKFGGVDWNKVRERYAPLVARTNSDQELHLLLQQMLNELHQSHFVIIPKEAIPKLRLKHKSAGSTAGIDAATDADEMDELDDDTGEPITPLDRIGYKVTERLSTGIGIDLRVIGGAAVITRVQPGSAAARSGLRPGFVIKSVGGESLGVAIAQLEQSPIFHSLLRAEIPLVLLAEFINGEEQSPVSLVYLDGQNRQRAVRITREKLKGEMSPAIGNLPALFAEFESRRLAGGIGYIRFNAFVPTEMKKTCAALREMHDARGLIIDLRGNQGGLLGMVSGLTGLLETAPVVIGTIQTRTGSSPLVAFPQQAAYSGPIVILIDGTTQSAAEMFASALQESGRATVAGELSAGNTLPSVIMKLPTGALFQYGFGNYLSVDGIALEGHGVTPDVNANLSRATLLGGADRQLAAAIRKIRELASLVETPSLGSVRVISDVSPPARPPNQTPSRPTETAGRERSREAEAAPPPPPPRSLSGLASAPAPPPAISGLPSVDQVIEHYLEALGGRATLAKLTSRVSKGTVELGSMRLSGHTEIYERAPNRSTVVINVDGLGMIQQTFDGANAWLQDPLRGYIKFSSAGAASARKNAEFQKELRMKELNPGLAVIGKEKVGGRETYVLQAPPFVPGSEKWYFDVDSGLLLRQANTYFEDYRSVDGMKLPFTIRDDAEGFGSIVRLSEIKHNVIIDDAKFIEYPDCFTRPEPVRVDEHQDARHRP